MSESKVSESKTEVVTPANVPQTENEKSQDIKIKDALLKFLFTNPNTGERMDYAESRMMYG